MKSMCNVFPSWTDRDVWIDEHGGATVITRERAREILSESGDIAVDHCECGESLYERI